MHRAVLNRKLIVVLALTALVATGFWIFRVRSGLDVPATRGPMTLYCPTCGEQKTTDVKWEGRKFLCPECNQYTASFQNPNANPAGVTSLP